MFERFTDPVTLIRLAKEGDMARLRKLISGGCRLDRRTGLDPWMTPLDAASAAGNPECVEVLLSGGAPLWGSSIYEAIKVDAEAVLHVFHRHDKEFYRSFSKDKDFCANPRLNRWLLLFTALDFALSLGSKKCSAFLETLGASKKQSIKQCRNGCLAVLIEEESFLIRGGTNIDGRAEVTEGYYCAKCEAFLRGAM